MSKRFIIGMSIELFVFLVVVVVGGSLLLVRLPKGDTFLQRVENAFRREPTPVVPMGNEETTSKPGVYRCADGKSFMLTVRSDGTARVTGASSSGVVLRRTSGTAIWTGADAKVAVREIAGYTVLIENGVTTRDRCALQK